jgi:hypothetical protein
MKESGTTSRIADFVGGIECRVPFCWDSLNNVADCMPAGSSEQKRPIVAYLATQKPAFIYEQLDLYFAYATPYSSRETLEVFHTISTLILIFVVFEPGQESRDFGAACYPDMEPTPAAEEAGPGCLTRGR